MSETRELINNSQKRQAAGCSKGWEDKDHVRAAVDTFLLGFDFVIQSANVRKVIPGSSCHHVYPSEGLVSG